MYWDLEWVEVSHVLKNSHGKVIDLMRLTRIDSQLEKAMGEAPQLPEGMTEAKKKAVDDILMMAASRPPRPPDNVSVCEWHCRTQSMDQRSCR